MTLGHTSVRKCAPVIFVQSTSGISAMRYAVKTRDIRLCRVKKHEYNIAKANGFYIAFAFWQKYRCKRQFAISLYTPKNYSFIFGCYLPFSKYVTHYDIF